MTLIPDDSSGRAQIYDRLRHKMVALTPEEEVRQRFVTLLIDHLGYPPELMANEYLIRIGKLSKRCDTVVFASEDGLVPLMVIEYKAPYVPLSQGVIDQAFRYNSELHVPYILITNGAQVALYRVGYGGTPTEILSSIPRYEELCR